MSDTPSTSFLPLTGHAKDLGGGFTVRRLLPAVQRKAVGPFLFFDHFGPVTVAPGGSHDVRPHPHIGLATVTFLWSGAIHHRDTLGSEQVIAPGDVNWMTAGRGIAHSERTPPDPRASGHAVHGMQTWVALPKADEEVAPSFHHHAASTLPLREHAGATLRVIAGRGFGMESPVRVFADTFNVAVDLAPDAELPIEADAVERALYVLEGEAQLDGADLPEKHLVVLDRGARHVLRAKTPLKAMLFGGEPLDAPRHMWWNFVSSRKERIVQAARDWEAQAIGQVPGETEWIALPPRRFKP